MYLTLDRDDQLHQEVGPLNGPPWMSNKLASPRPSMNRPHQVSLAHNVYKESHLDNHYVGPSGIPEVGLHSKVI